MTVREVAIELPQSTRLFEKLRIDYCCGGNRPLTEACTLAGLEVGEVMGMLEAVSQLKNGEGPVNQLLEKKDELFALNFKKEKQKTVH